ITAYPARVDMVTFTPWERTYQVWKGTERVLDPDLWGPDEKTIGSNGRVEVSRVLVTYNQIEILDRTLA
ncbi:hypothetical protein JI664_23790, partial [Rhodobacter sp. NTK016B]|uniref:hypothetical protein n=1 Tax=Rhodobacter sp. NTK016B TaxID=2759676 RepID=UPI001A900057